MKKVSILCSLPMDPVGAAMLTGVADIVVAPGQSAESLYKTIASADILVVRSQLPMDLFDRPNRLIGVVRHGTGLDLIPVASATAHNIPVANVPGVNSQAVVEYCVSTGPERCIALQDNSRRRYSRGSQPVAGRFIRPTQSPRRRRASRHGSGLDPGRICHCP